MRNHHIKIKVYNNHLAIRVYVADLKTWCEYPIYERDMVDILSTIRKFYNDMGIVDNG